jgi:hypothetical protein
MPTRYNSVFKAHEGKGDLLEEDQLIEPVDMDDMLLGDDDDNLGAIDADNKAALDEMMLVEPTEESRMKSTAATTGGFIK